MGFFFRPDFLIPVIYGRARDQAWAHGVAES